MRRRDRGSILAITLVIVVVLGAVIAAVATYASTTLRYGQVVERSADRLAAVNGGLDSALEALDRQSSPCALTTLANAGYEYDLLQPTAAVNTINGVNPRIRCLALGGTVSGVEEFALVLTGDPGTGTRSGPLLTVNGSITPRKVINGPVFMAQRPNIADSLSLNAPLTIQNGDLWYGRSTCPAPDVSVPLAPAGTANLLLTPAGYTIKCLPTGSGTWRTTLFNGARPTEAAVGGFGAPAAPVVDDAGCKVFSPGRYATQPVLAQYNYFKSGDYYLDGIGDLNIANSYVLFGWPGPTGPGIPGAGNDTLGQNKCIAAWERDARSGAPGREGATVFVGGNTRFTIGNNGSLEISGKRQAQASNRLIGLQALEVEGNPSTVQGDAAELVTVGSGNGKQVSIEGLVWAPFASLNLDNVANEAVAALNGGAVVSEISLQAPASATNFLLTSGATAGDRLLEFTVTATSPQGGKTQARAVVRYNSGEYAVESRRVLCITPNEPVATPC